MVNKNWHRKHLNNLYSPAINKAKKIFVLAFSRNQKCIQVKRLINRVSDLEKNCISQYMKIGSMSYN